MTTVWPFRSAMEIVLASFFTLSIWAAASATVGNLSPSFTFSLVSSAGAADDASIQAAAARAERAAKRSMAELREWQRAGRAGAGVRAKRVRRAHYRTRRVRQQVGRSRDFLRPALTT